MLNLREDETGGRDVEGYVERVDPGDWMVRGLRGLKSVVSKRRYFVVDALRDF